MIDFTPSALRLKPDFQNHLQLHDDATRALWLSQLTQAHPERLFVMICQDQQALNGLETELAFFGVEAEVFADWETLAYDRLSPHQDIVSERIHLLSQMPTSGVLLVAATTALQKLAPVSWLLGQHFDVAVGAKFDIATERERLIRAGYTIVDNVHSPGEVAVRGGVVDIFVMGQALPLRLELFDDEVERMRFFNPETQRTLTTDELAKMKREHHADGVALHKLPEHADMTVFSLLPAREFPLVAGRELFRQNFASVFPDVSHRKVDFFQDVMAGIAPQGIEYYQPLFFDADAWQDSSLFSYLPANAVLIYETTLYDKLHAYQAQVKARYDNYRHDAAHPILAPEWLFLGADDFFCQLKKYANLVLGAHKKAAAPFEGIVSHAPPNLAINHQAPEALSLLLEFVQHSDVAVMLVAETAGRREILLDLLKGKLDVKLVADFAGFMAAADAYRGGVVALGVAPIERGLYLTDDLGRGIAIISETQLFGRQVLQTRRRKATGLSQAFLIKSVTELTEGALVVHMAHGIGRYQGLVKLDASDGEQEFIHLSYADDASIYVPMTHLALIGRYSGMNSAEVPLSKIGSGRWDRARQKALEQIYDVAAELLNIQARRNAKSGIHFNIDMAQYELFASQFAFEETADQRAAIDALMADMRATKPMDRLICGDVGFGKTEVAMRAAFIAVQAGYQVAVLVPTTLLAGQHEENFRSRFADWAVNIESLSRFGTKKQHDKVLADLKAGKVDIIIGTHRLLQDDVSFAKLGLMIVDEEHRFGVRHKEKIKAMQSDVDCLSMTATPIPRTLNMALSGMQDISIIATPPARRLAIKTFVLEKSTPIIKEAILREILRGGQVYYLHNDVASIDAVAEGLSELMHEVRVGVAHGQMNEQALAAVMGDFYHKKTNVLVASTIIETGIDVPNANTIIINRADKFGLAQLHQLRGRVGRSHHQAYCYLLVPSMKGLSADAERRLNAIARANTLGAGFVLASEDLEIRGAGELLGKEQSGHMQSIGFGLYMDMLSRATRAIKQGKAPKLDTPLDLVSDINMHTSALIPDDYMGDVHERLLFYKRIASAETLDELSDLRTEMIDRFGVMPVVLAHLFLVHRVRILLKPLGIVRVDVSAHSLTLEFSPDTPVDGMAIIRLIQSDAGYRMNGATGLKYQFKSDKDVNERFEALFELLKYFTTNTIESKA